jgi:hypothetical protein
MSMQAKSFDVTTARCWRTSGSDIDGERIAVAAWKTPPKGATIIDWSKLTVLPPASIDLRTPTLPMRQPVRRMLLKSMKTNPAATALISANAAITLSAGFY